MSKIPLLKRDDPYTRQLYNRGGTYVTYLYLGSNQQKVAVSVDTGSADLWVVDSVSGCGQNPCKDGVYDPSSSTTSKKLNDTFQIGYADLSGAKGNFYTDSVALGKCDNCAKIKDFQFADATETSTSGGILGIGLKNTELTENKYPNFIYAMKQQDLIDSSAYSLYLNEKDAATGSIIFGGKDLAKIDGNLVPLPVTSDSQLTVKVKSIDINDTKIEMSGDALIDSGTTLMAFTEKDGDAFFLNFKGGQYSEDAGYYLCDCDAEIDQKFTVNFSGISFEMDISDAFASSIVKSGKDYGCGFHIGRWNVNIFSDIFIRNAYTVFDYDSNTISLGKVKFTSDSDIVPV